MYEASLSKFILIVESKTEKEKLENKDILSGFGDYELTLSFLKPRFGPLKNGKEPTFATHVLPEYISDQAVRLAFSNFGEVVSVVYNLGVLAHFAL